MQYRTIGNSGINASVVAFGAWAIGGWKWGGTDVSQSVSAIRAAIDSGVNFIDTAAVYGFGLSEEIVGKAIQGYARDKLVIATKCGLRWDIESPVLHVESEGRRVFRTLSADSIRTEVEQSLARLQTDYIDLYQTHWPDKTTAPEEVIATLAALRKQGLIRAIGFCNASVQDLQLAIASGELHADQEKYSLLDREREADNLPLCAESSTAFLAYSPIAQGLLSGRIDATRKFAAGDLRNDSPRFSLAARESIARLLEPLHAIASEREVSVEQIVLAWTLTRPGLSHVLVGARNAEQASSNAIAGNIILSDAELALIDTAADSWAGFSAQPQ